jgi:hypothetical protein
MAVGPSASTPLATRTTYSATAKTISPPMSAAP